MRRGLLLIAAAAAAVVAGALVFAAVANVSILTGLYWGVETATTVGYGDVTPDSSDGRAVAAVVMLVTIPLLAAAFGVITSAHLRHHMTLHRQATEQHLTGEVDRMRQHVDTAILGVHRRLDQHADLIRTAAGNGDAPAAERLVPSATGKTSGGRRKPPSPAGQPADTKKE